MKKWRLVTHDSSFKDSCLREEQNSWALAGNGPGLQEVEHVCAAREIGPGRLILPRRT